tara:strand:- start:8055 stop:8753 length:699 start_codon:yes stop_codon:yes gene_type:complete
MNVSIVTPVHNEQGNISKLLDDLIKLESSLKNFEIIVVDDNSSDKTGLIAHSYSKKYRNIKVLHRSKGINGMGAALKEGTKAAKGKYIVWIMGDNSDDTTTIPKIIEKMKSGYDVVFGSRYMAGGSKGDSNPFKAMLGTGYTFVARLIFGIKVHDITNPFRAFKKEIFNTIKLECNDFAISPEFSIKSHLRGYKLAEVPTVYSNRKTGQSNFKMLKMGINYIRLFKYRFVRF